MPDLSPQQPAEPAAHPPRRIRPFTKMLFVVGVFFAAAILMVALNPREAQFADWGAGARAEGESAAPPPPPKPILDFADYDRRMRRLAHSGEFAPKPAASPEAAVPDEAPPEPALWPVNAPYPKVGAILPFHRIIAYYGNFYAKGMGVLGEYEEDEMFRRFQKEIDLWNAADPETPVMPAIDYIAITAQLAAGADGKYRARMPHDQIDHALELAAKVDGIVILEVQAGFSDILTETKSFGDYLKHPKIHVAIDPEFAMLRRGERPGRVVGTVSAAELNEVIRHLSQIVRENDLPPKVLVVHRYTRAMVSEATDIKPTPEVQVVMDMDGWGPGPRKFSTYNSYIRPEPVQFTGFKLFYKNDVKNPGTVLLTPEEVLSLTPSPSFIQFQ